MKTTLKSAGLVALILLATGYAHAATVNPFTDLGSAGPANFSILALGGCQTVTGTTTCDVGKTNVLLTGNGSRVGGSVGFLPHNPNTTDGGDLKGDNSGTIKGDVVLDTAGTVTGMGPGNSLVSHGVTLSNSLDTLAAGVISAYNDAQLQCTGATDLGGANCVKLANNQVIVTTTFNASGTNNGKVILVDITTSNGIKLTGGSTLTLNGDASTSYIINISGGSAFSLTSGADILLTGGILAKNVLFNVVGSTGGAVCFSSTTSCTDAVTGSVANRAEVAGIVLAPLRDIHLDGSTVDGEVISGNLTITVDDSNLVPEPGTMLAFASGLTALGMRFRRLRRK